MRPVAETIPVVSVRSSPNGCPIAATGSPTINASESPSRTGLIASPLGSTRTTARSFALSNPCTRPSTVLPSLSPTVTVVAPCTTW